MIQKIDISNINELKVFGIRKSINAADFNPDTLYAIESAGLTLISVVQTGKPSITLPGDYGLFEHYQRVDVGSVGFSQIIKQVFTSNNGVHIRKGIGNGNSISYSPWTKIV